MIIKKSNYTLKFIFNILPSILKYTPILSCFSILFGILHGISNVANTIITQLFLDKVPQSLTEIYSIKTLIFYALLVALSLILCQIFMGLHNLIFDAFSSKVECYLNNKLNSKISEIDPILFEDSDILDSINKSKKGIDGFISLLTVISTLLTFYIPYFLFMELYLFKLDKILSLSIIFIFIPVCITQFIRVKIFNDLENTISPFKRKYIYFKKCLLDKEYFKETRLLKANSYFNNLYTKYLQKYNTDILKSERKANLLELLMKIITLLGYSGLILLLCRSLFSNKITIGAFIAIFNSIDLMIILMEELICIHFGRFTRELSSVKNLAKFFTENYRTGIINEFNLDNGIILENVSFAYPNSGDYILKNINLHIKPRETIAIVGVNGSGKTTLTKLLSGLYLPSNGSIKIGNISLSDINPNIIYSNVSSLFQQYAKYKMTLKENIIISNPSEINNDYIEKAIKYSELDLENFDFNYDTMLCKEFDGIDISGGQWQRIALSRCFYKQSNLIILDEPTAAIDPLEESNLYNKFSILSQNTISIIVTHKIGAAKIADRILVLNNGELIELGTHKELLSLKGEYYKMYTSQSKWYIDTIN